MMRVRAIRLLTANIVLGAVSLSSFLGTTVGVAAASATSQPPGGSSRYLPAPSGCRPCHLRHARPNDRHLRVEPGLSGPVRRRLPPGPDRLEVTDSEVDQTTGAGYHGVNLWQITRSGTVTDTGTTLAYSSEPTGLGHDPGTNTLFISDDNKHRVWVVKPGSDTRFGTSDDIVTWIDARGYGSIDTEDPTFDPATGHLFFLDGKATEVYEIDPVNGTFGDGNDVMTHFDVGHFGPADWEGLGSDTARGTLLVGARREEQIYEVTKSGSLVRIIDASGVTGS